MGEMPELKEKILTVAGDLFAKNGYAATSIKQIAKEAGCTTAALYYYFEDGKAHILREVVRSYSTHAIGAVDEEGEFDDLSAYLDQLAQRVGQIMPEVRRRLNWLTLELHNLPAEERDEFVEQYLSLPRAIRARLEQFLGDRERANMLAWIVVCAFMGYGQLFQTLGFEDQSAPSLDEFGQALMGLVSQAG